MSSSSAMPDPSLPDVPRLKARVHRRLSATEYAQISPSQLSFRALQPRDVEEVVALHTEWFPVCYDEGFYTKSVHGEIFTLAAIHISERPTNGIHGGASSSSAPAEPLEENLLGIITMSTSPEHHNDDDLTHLGFDVPAFCGKAQSDGAGTGDLENPHAPIAARPPAAGCVAYILTLGIVDGFRRRGLARELLERSIRHVDDHMPHVQAVYLHVVTYNDAAIRLYESMNFLRIAHFKQFYFLHGSSYDSYLYAYYLHDARPPWKWRLRKFLGATWLEWVWSTVTTWSPWCKAETSVPKATDQAMASSSAGMP